MVAALISRQRVVAVKTEGTSGTAETLAAADGVMNCYDSTYTPEVNMSERQSQGTYDANLASVSGARMGRISFRTDLVASSSSLLFSRVIPHAGFTVSSLVATAVGSASTSTATVALYVDGLRHLLAGAVVSSLQIDFEAGEPMYATVEYVGKYVAPTDASLLSPTYETTTPIRFGGTSPAAAFTFASGSLNAFSGNIRIENTVAMRPLGSDASGYFHAQITRQAITASANAEAVLEATRDDYAEWISQTTGALALIAGSATFSIPNAQRINLQPGDTNGIFSRQLDFLHTGSSAMTITMPS